MLSTILLWCLSHVSLFGNYEDKQSVSVPVSVEVIISLSDYFGSSCVYFIQNSDNNIQDGMYKREVIKRQKLLSTQLIPTTTLSILGNLSDARCRRNRRLLVITNKVNTRDLSAMKPKQMSDNIWVLFLDKDSSIDQFLTGVNIPFNCQFLVAQRDDDHIVKFTEVYRVSEGLSLHTNRFGNWTERNGLSGPTGSLYERRHNLHGLVLKVGFRSDHCTPKDFSRCRKSRSTGFILSIWRMMERELNFKSEYYLPNDDNYGMVTKNGSWDGLIGMLQKGEIDVSNVNFVVTLERQRVVDFTVPILETRLQLTIKASDAYLLNWYAFMSPLSFGLWKTTLGVIIFCSIILGVTSKLVQKYARNNDDILNFSTSIFIVLGAFCSQGHAFCINSDSLKIIILTTYLTAIILFTSYSGSLVSYLTVRNPKLPFISFRTFLEDGSYKLLVIRNSAMLDLFKKSRVKLFRDIYEKQIQPHEPDLPSSELEGLEHLCSENKLAYFGPSYVLEYTQDNTVRCSLVLIPEAFFPLSIAIALKKHSPYRGLLNYRLQEMRRNGILNSVMELSPKFKYQSAQEAVVPSIGLEEFAPFLCLLGSGGILACFIFLAEVCINCTKEVKMKRK